jgi:hypothetical protein
MAKAPSERYYPVPRFPWAYIRVRARLPAGVAASPVARAKGRPAKNVDS